MANDMQQARARFEAVCSGHFEAGQDPLEAFIGLYAEDAVMYFQGRDWPYAGRHQGRAAIARLFREGMALFSAPLEFWSNRLWILDDEHLLWWWRSRSVSFRGQPLSNSGLTLLRYRDNLIIEHHEYTDTEYLVEMFAGWRERMPTAGDRLPAWPRVEAGRAFADSGRHDLDRP